MAEKKTPKDAPAPAVKTVTVQGIKITVDPAQLDDWEITEAVADIQFGAPEDALKAVFLARKVLGDQYEMVKEHLKKRTGGHLSNETFSAFIKDVFQAASPNS